MRSSTFRRLSAGSFCRFRRPIRGFYIQKTFRRSSTFRRPSGGPLNSEHLQKTYKSCSSFRRPSGCLLRSEQLQKVFQVPETFYVQETFRRSSMSGSLLISENLQAVFNFRRCFIFQSPSSLLLSEDLREIFYFQKFFRRGFTVRSSSGSFHIQKSFKMIFGMSSMFIRSSGHCLSIYRKECFPHRRMSGGLSRLLDHQDIFPTYKTGRRSSLP